MGVTRVLDLDGLQGLIAALAARGYTVVGPTVRDGAVVHGRIARVDDLPRGRGDEQDAGHYRLRADVVGAAGHPRGVPPARGGRDVT